MLPGSSQRVNCLVQSSKRGPTDRRPLVGSRKTKSHYSSMSCVIRNSRKQARIVSIRAPSGELVSVLRNRSTDQFTENAERFASRRFCVSRRVKKLRRSQIAAKHEIARPPSSLLWPAEMLSIEMSLTFNREAVANTTNGSGNGPSSTFGIAGASGQPHNPMAGVTRRPTSRRTRPDRWSPRSAMPSGPSIPRINRDETC